MSKYDIIIIGAGISGLSFAHYSAKAGLKALVIEKSARPGGCLRTERLPSGFWFELGAHTCYNSYGNLIGIAEDLGIKDKIKGREKVPFKMLVGGRVKSIPSELNIPELVCSAPRVLYLNKSGLTVEAYYSKITGKGNYKRVIGPAMSAVPSQDADGFPANMLFKKRSRREDVIKKFTFEDGLETVADALSSQKGIGLMYGAEPEAVSFEGGRFRVKALGEEFESPRLALAVPPPVAAKLLMGPFPDLAALLSMIKSVGVESTGVVVKKESVSLPPFAGLIPTGGLIPDRDIFYSAVSRDIVPDKDYRGFSFHFRPGIGKETKLKRIADVLGVSTFEHVAENKVVLPSPEIGHEALMAGIDLLIEGKPLYLTGNYFSGLAIEDCVTRSKREFERLMVRT